VVRGVGANRILAPLAVVMAFGAVYGLASFGHAMTLGSGKQIPAPRSAAATSVVRACPSLGLAGTASGDVALVAAPATTGAGQAQVSRLGGAGVLQHSLTQPGQLSVTTVRAQRPARHTAGTGTGTPGSGAKGSAGTGSPGTGAGSQPVPTAPAAGGVIVRATGSMARGLEVEQVGSGGVPLARCESPGTDFWFVGPGLHGLARIQLYLMNPGSQSADVNVEVSTDAGPLQGSTDTGIAVAPHAMVVQTLGPVLHGSRVLALHVRTSVGQVVAGVQESTSTGGGGAWLPVAQSPATRVVLPGLPAAAGTRQLFVAVPGIKDAHLKLIAVTTKGSYQPTGGTGLDIPGGSAISIVLPSLSGVPAALKLSSNVPITASAMLTGGSSGAPGVLTAAAPPVAEQGVVAYNKAGGGADSQLVLSAPGHPVRAQITQIGSNGTTGQPKIVQIPSGHSTVAQLGKGGGSGRRSVFAVVVTPLPGSGLLYAGRVIIGSGTGGRVEALLPVPSALTMVPLPHVANAFITTGP
jgi:Family of unknown function (DUF5719)